MTNLRELEKRLEEATGPSKELDDAVFRACGLKLYPYETWGTAYPVTKSLDAAVALVERVLPSNRDDGRAWLQLLADAVTTALISDAKPEDMARLVCINLIRALSRKVIAMTDKSNFSLTFTIEQLTALLSDAIDEGRRTTRIAPDDLATSIVRRALAASNPKEEGR